MVEEKKLTEVIETFLFVSPRSLTIQQLKDLVGTEPSTKELRQAVLQLNSEYELTGRVFRIEDVAGVPNEDGAKGPRVDSKGRCHQTISADPSESGNSLNCCLQAARHSRTN